MPTTTDLLGFAIDRDPIDFASAVDDLLRQKAVDALDARRVELAKSIYGSEEAADDTFDFADDDVIDDDDLGDIDLNDIDLDDLDLEGIEDDDQDA